MPSEPEALYNKITHSLVQDMPAVKAGPSAPETLTTFLEQFLNASRRDAAHESEEGAGILGCRSLPGADLGPLARLSFGLDPVTATLAEEAPCAGLSPALPTGRHMHDTLVAEE